MAKFNSEIVVFNHFPRPPKRDDWEDKGRDHHASQFIVPLEAWMAGLHGSAGCPTQMAATARSQAERDYYTRSIKPDKMINQIDAKIE